VATVSLDGETPVAVLITRAWGFVVVKTEDSVFVSSVNGVRLRKVAAAGVPLKWTAFRDRDGFDFIVFADATGIHCFEVMDPGKTTKVYSHIAGLVDVSFDWRSGCFLIVCASGKTIVQPRTQSE